MEKIKLLHYINEIVSRDTYKKKFFKSEREQTKQQKYKTVLKDIIKKFFTPKGSSIPKRSLVIPLKDTKRKPLVINDIKIINYLNKNGYSCTKESYDLGQCTNKSGVTESIVNVLTQIKSYDINAEKKKLDNPKVPDIGKEQARERISRFNNLDKSLVNYYEKEVSVSNQMIVFTWVPRKIASQSTDVGWTSCQELFAGERKIYVFPSIGEGAFIAWLVKRGDEFKLDNPIARTLIKVYKDRYGNKLWWPDNVYGTTGPLFIERVKDFLREKQADTVLLRTAEMIGTQYDDDNVKVVWDPWTAEDLKAKSTNDKYKEILNQQKYSEKEMVKIVFKKIKEDDLNLINIKKIFENACILDNYELAFRLYKQYNFEPDDDVLELSLTNLNHVITRDGKIFNFLIKDKRIKKLSKSIIMKIISNGVLPAFKAAIKYKKIDIDKNKIDEYATYAKESPIIIRVLMDDYGFKVDFKTCYNFVSFGDPENSEYVVKKGLEQLGKISREKTCDIFQKAINYKKYSIAKFIIDNFKIRFTEEENERNSFFERSMMKGDLRLIDLVIDNVDISKKEKVDIVNEKLIFVKERDVKLLKHFIEKKKLVSEDDIVTEKLVEFLHKLEPDDEMRLYLLNRFKKLADMFNKHEVKYAPPRNLDDFDYTTVFFRFNPKNILKEIDLKKEAIASGWDDGYEDSTNHKDYDNEDCQERMKGVFLRKRKRYNDLVSKDRQISDTIIYDLINNKDLTKKEKVDFVNFVYFIVDNNLMVTEKSEESPLDFIAYTKAFNIRKQAESNAFSKNPKSIYNIAEPPPEKLEVPKIKVKDYISSSYYREIDDDEQEELIEWTIEDLYRTAFKLKMNNLSEITKAIKDMYGDDYVDNKMSLEIFKAYKDDDLRVHMPLYKKYNELKEKSPIEIEKKIKKKIKKMEVPKINVKDYISDRQYREIDEEEEEQIEWTIEDLYKIAIKLSMTDQDEVDQAIKDMYGYTYVTNPVSLQIFSAALEDEDVYHNLSIHMPLYDDYEKLVKKKEIKTSINTPIKNIQKQNNADKKSETKEINKIIKKCLSEKLYEKISENKEKYTKTIKGVQAIFDVLMKLQTPEKIEKVVKTLFGDKFIYDDDSIEVLTEVEIELGEYLTRQIFRETMPLWHIYTTVVEVRRYVNNTYNKELDSKEGRNKIIEGLIALYANEYIDNKKALEIFLRIIETSKSMEQSLMSSMPLYYDYKKLAKNKEIKTPTKNIQKQDSKEIIKKSLSEKLYKEISKNKEKYTKTIKGVQVIYDTLVEFETPGELEKVVKTLYGDKFIYDDDSIKVLSIIAPKLDDDLIPDFFSEIMPEWNRYRTVVDVRRYVLGQLYYGQSKKEREETIEGLTALYANEYTDNKKAREIFARIITTSSRVHEQLIMSSPIYHKYDDIYNGREKINENKENIFEKYIRKLN